MTPFDRSKDALERISVRKVLEESNLPIEIATAIADALEAPRPEDGGITQALVQMARDNAIEECAALCDETAQLQSEMAQSSEEESMVTYRKARAWDASVCAAKIRALKQSTPQKSSP